jgi:hypothetical protein
MWLFEDELQILFNLLSLSYHIQIPLQPFLYILPRVCTAALLDLRPTTKGRALRASRDERLPNQGALEQGLRCSDSLKL